MNILERQKQQKLALLLHKACTIRMHFCHQDPKGPWDPRSKKTAPQETAAFRLTGGNSELQSSGSDLLG